MSRLFSRHNDRHAANKSFFGGGGELSIIDKQYKSVDSTYIKLNRKALHFLLNIRFNPLEKSLFKGIRKLPPGTILRFQRSSLRQQRYWSLPDSVDSSIHRPEDCIEETKMGLHFRPLLPIPERPAKNGNKRINPGTDSGAGDLQPFIEQILTHPPHRWMRWHYFLL